MSDCKELCYDKDHGRFEWIGGRHPPAIEAETSAFSYDVPWLEFYGLKPDELCKRWNNHERLKQLVSSLVEFVEVNVGDTTLTREAQNFLTDLEAEKGDEP